MPFSTLHGARLDPPQGFEGLGERPCVDVETMRAIYAATRSLVPSRAEAPVRGYRLVRVHERQVSWVNIGIHGTGYAVVGSHARCDLVLGDDACIWLRHLAAICVRLEDDSVGLRLIDLQTDEAFFCDDDAPRRSALMRGHFAMRLGRHVLCGFSTGDSPRAANVSHSCAAASPLAPSPSPNHVQVTLEHRGEAASVELSSEALDAGVLLGRADNCFNGGLGRVFDEAISRTHLLLLRDRSGIFAFDLASTNGTRVNGSRIRRFRVPEGGGTLELGKRIRLTIGSGSPESRGVA